jgi:hypothetical protein
MSKKHKAGDGADTPVTRITTEELRKSTSASRKSTTAIAADQQNPAAKKKKRAGSWGHPARCTDEECPAIVVRMPRLVEEPRRGVLCHRLAC